MHIEPKIDKPKLPLTPYEFQITPPENIQFENPDLQELLKIVKQEPFYVLNDGTVNHPAELKGRELKIGNSLYTFGVGGLHSTEKSVSYFSTEDAVLTNADIASYYPNTILKQGYEPESMKGYFTNQYRRLVEERLAAKRDGDKNKAQLLKIATNGVFGKLNSVYSALFSPKLHFHVTITGQLYLLKLIEMLEQVNIPVVSANTDGLLTHCPPSLLDEQTYKFFEFETMTGYTLETEIFGSYHAKDVNNYLAVGLDFETKAKGIFVMDTINKNPDFNIATEAVIEFLVHGTSINETIFKCQDIRRFVKVITANGGAEDQEGNYLGQVVRFYRSTEVEGSLKNCVNGNKIPKSDHCRPAMDLPDSLPDDIDYAFYIATAESILMSVGHHPASLH